MTRKERNRFEEAASIVYNIIGPDMGWLARTPSDEEFFDVIRNHMEMELTNDELTMWRLMTITEKRRIILAIGP